MSHIIIEISVMGWDELDPELWVCTHLESVSLLVQEAPGASWVDNGGLSGCVILSHKAEKKFLDLKKQKIKQYSSGLPHDVLIDIVSIDGVTPYHPGL